ncbi:hypothetical protein AAK899_06970 [Erysipelotrichaceae bacterium 51-3]|uniref:hypothetical protein n=1 Tax=Allobaculum sp. JKK-2023 TaxID=3108943 RepID=UPI002B05B3E3|nr:hypothetical protein [Allobaculum sp. JKK-2023]
MKGQAKDRKDKLTDRRTIGIFDLYQVDFMKCLSKNSFIFPCQKVLTGFFGQGQKGLIAVSIKIFTIRGKGGLKDGTWQTDSKIPNRGQTFPGTAGGFDFRFQADYFKLGKRQKLSGYQKSRFAQ